MLPPQKNLTDDEHEENLRLYKLHGLVAPSEEKYLVEAFRRNEARRAAEISAKRDAREEEILAIAKEANSIAKEQASAAWRAARYAMYAAIIATISALVASKDEIFRLIFGNS